MLKGFNRGIKKSVFKLGKDGSGSTEPALISAVRWRNLAFLSCFSFLSCCILEFMKEKEDPEIPLHLRAPQQTPAGWVLLVIAINEFIPAPGTEEGWGKSALFELWAIPCKAGGWIGWDLFGIKCPTPPQQQIWVGFLKEWLERIN